MKVRPVLRFSAIIAGVTAGSFLASLAAPALLHTSAAQGKGRPTPEVQRSLTAPLANLSSAFRAVHRSIENAVVNIHTVQTIKGAVPGIMQLPAPFRKLLPPGQTFPLQPGSGKAPVEKLFGTGSGVILSPDGYIVTNNHVVAGAQSIEVRLRDHRSYPAKVVGTDPKTDLAVIKINASHLTYAKFGHSSKMHVGDWVLAFGSPFGFSQTMTQGIISAKGRDLNIITEHNPKLRGLTYENFLQTDAAINPGNSGGPLVNLKGHVIGIDSAIASSTGGFAGLGFAIPSSEARQIVKDLIKHGKVVRGYMGVGIADVQQGAYHRVAKSFGYKSRHGVLITQVLPGGPAAAGGLRQGDIVTAVNGKTITSMNAMRDEIAMMRPGTKVHLRVFRKGKIVHVEFPLGTQPNYNPMAMGGAGTVTPHNPQTVQSHKLGVTVRDMDPAMRKRYHINRNRGVLVTSVDPNGLAAAAGIAPGDVISSVQGQPVRSASGFKAAVTRQNFKKGFRVLLRGPNGSENYTFVSPKQ